MKYKLHLLTSGLLLLLVFACSEDEPAAKTWEFLPEDLIAVSDEEKLTARYVDPTTRYKHGILGNEVEGGGLLVVKNGIEYYYPLKDEYVFEDLRPRLKDIDNDGLLEFICIKSSQSRGASIAIYKIVNEKLTLLLNSEFIGRPNRWLNIAAISDLDKDGNMEMAWIQTPHIGGTLKVARFQGNSLAVLDEIKGFSNHKIASGNLCLSVVSDSLKYQLLTLPNDAFDSLFGFRLQEDSLKIIKKIRQVIDPQIPLFKQLNLKQALDLENCIYVP